MKTIDQRLKEEQQFRENLIEKIANEYDFGREIAKACVDKGWLEGYLYGYNYVRTQSQNAADFAEKILAIIEPA